MSRSIAACAFARDSVVAEAHLHRLPVARDAAVADVLVAQQLPHVADVAIGRLRQRAVHVDLQQEVDAAAQVEAQVHGQRVDRAHPVGRVRQQVQRDDVLLAEHLLDDVLRLQLRVGIGELDLQVLGLEQRALRLDALLRESFLDAGHE
jgi:hypothetical protein